MEKVKNKKIISILEQGHFPGLDHDGYLRYCGAHKMKW